MWFIVWAFVITPVGDAGVIASVARQHPPFDTEAACVAYVEKYAPRMPDYFRGLKNVDLDDAIMVRGVCQQEGDPA